VVADLRFATDGPVFAGTSPTTMNTAAAGAERARWHGRRRPLLPGETRQAAGSPARVELKHNWSTP